MDQKNIRDLSSVGRHQDCLQICEKILEHEPDNQLAWKFTIKSLIALGDFDKAEQFLAKAQQLDNTDDEIKEDIGKIFLNAGNKGNHEKLYEKAIAFNIQDPAALINLAKLNSQNGNDQKAIDLYKLAIHADSKLIEPYIGAAESLLKRGNYDEAESFAAQALELNEEAQNINQIFGLIFQVKDNSEQAIFHYKKELVVNPESSISLLNLGLLLLKQGQITPAIEALSKASVIEPSEKCSRLLAQAYQKDEQFIEAIIEYNKLDLRESKDKLIPFNLGLCLMKTGDNTSAIKAFQISAEIDKTFIPALGNIGTAFINKKSYQEALFATQKVLDIEEKNPIAHMNLGIIYRELGDLNKALAATLQSLEIYPNNSTALTNLGSIYKDLGNLDQALTSTLKSVELNPDDSISHLKLGCIYKDIGNLEKALSSTLKSVELNPDNPIAHMNLGIIYKELGKNDLALSATYKALELRPDDHIAYLQLGTYYYYLGKIKEARTYTLKSLDLNPKHFPSAWNMHGFSKDTQEAEKYINLCLSIDGSNIQAKIIHAALRHHQGDSTLLNNLFQSPYKNHPYVRSAKWVTSLPHKPLLFFNRCNFYDQIIDICIQDRPFYEFGVMHGASFKYLIKKLKNGFGFDTFEGLPENWHNEQKGSYSAHGKVPDIEGGLFISGKFEETLPAFFSKKQAVASIINFDADLYSSTLCALENCVSVIDSSTILIFDEFIINKHWEEDEYKALNDFCSRHEITYEVIAVSYITKQVAIKLIEKN